MKGTKLFTAFYEARGCLHSINKNEVCAVAGELFAFIADEIQAGRAVRVPGFGVFTAATRKGRRWKFTNYQGKKLDFTLPEHRVMKFKQSKRMKRMLNTDS